MKKAVTKVLLPTINSIDSTPFASVTSPVNVLKLVFIRIKSCSDYPSFSNVVHGMMFS
jgi:hypothetical protein